MYNNLIISRRLKKELPKIKEKYDVKDVSISESQFEKYKTSLTLNNNIVIKLSDEYPFRKPLLIINGKNYLDMLRTTSPYINNEIKILKGVECCLSCESVLCGNNWCVSYTLMKVLQEYEDNKKLFIHVFNKRYVPNICYKNNIFCNELIQNIQSYI